MLYTICKPNIFIGIRQTAQDVAIIAVYGRERKERHALDLHNLMDLLKKFPQNSNPMV